ncbi:hypothetical protein E2C01_045205 [Portunus trituberculatus]|uniref:Uncharacterized protein n=1 Tax=Portunus trituberculatus TaxID=210409 RepID=A0A5B7FXP3_PORTR|nr:hypothetical protein [Portunus trituberculatus]
MYVVEALQCRFGHLQQVEVHRSRLKVQVRGRAYPMAQEDMISLLAMDCFVDALKDSYLQIYEK